MSHLASVKTDWQDTEVKAYFNELLGRVKEVAQLNHIYRKQASGARSGCGAQARFMLR